MSFMTRYIRYDGANESACSNRFPGVFLCSDGLQEGKWCVDGGNVCVLYPGDTGRIFKPKYPDDWPAHNAQCDFSNVNIDDEVLSRLIARLPRRVESGRERYHTLFPGLEVGGLTFEGLNKLRQFGPAIPYCTNGTRMVQVDFFSDDQAQSWSPWKTCSGDLGRITLRAMFSRFTFQFRIVESTAAGVKMELDRLLPVAMQSVRIEVEGAGRAVRHVFEILSALVPSFTEEAWSKEFVRNANTAFRMISE